MNYREMSIKEMSDESGYSRKTLMGRVQKAGLAPRYEIRDGKAVAIYRIDETFLMTPSESIAYWHERGYVTVYDIAERNRISSACAFVKLRDAGIYPEIRIERNNMNLYRDDPRINEIITRKRTLPQHTKEDRMRLPYGEVGKLVLMEREKRKWIGRRGRIVVDGHVVVEGVIESVSSCGVYIKGSTTKGNLNELELYENGSCDDLRGASGRSPDLSPETYPDEVLPASGREQLGEPE